MFKLRGPLSLIGRLTSLDWFYARETSVQTAPTQERKTQIRFPHLETEWFERDFPIAPNVVDIPFIRYKQRSSDPIHTAITEVHNTIKRYGVNEVLVYCGAKLKQSQPGVVARDEQPERDAEDLLNVEPDHIVEDETKEPIYAQKVYDETPKHTRVYVVFKVGQKLDDRTALFDPI